MLRSLNGGPATVRSTPFEARRAVYAGLDSRLASRTRFYAAAAFINGVFAQLFRVVPSRWLPRVHEFLMTAGNVLLEENLKIAHAIDTQSLEGFALDNHLVRTEQALLQTFVDALEARRDGHWEKLRRELNDLLNGRHSLVLCSGGSAHLYEYRKVLDASRAEMNLALNFAEITHRISIGIGIIRHVRLRQIRAADTRGPLGV